VYVNVYFGTGDSAAATSGERTMSSWKTHGGVGEQMRKLGFGGWTAIACAVVVGTLALSASALAASLPDNRVYEMVSPAEKGSQVEQPRLAVADANGEHVIVDGGTASAVLSSTMSWEIETRTPTGWSGVQVGPAPTPRSYFVEQREVVLNAVSEDFSRFLFRTEMSLDPRDPNRNQDVYVRNGPGGPFEWITGPPAPAVKEPGVVLGNYPNITGHGDNECSTYTNCYGNDAWFAGASTDLRDIVWEQRTPMVAPPASAPGSPPDTHTYGYEIYESVGGVDQLVGLVPAAGAECDPSHGSCVVPPCGAAMGNEFYETNEQGEGGTTGFAPVRGAVTPDGSEVIFTSPDPATEVAGCPPPEVYVRRDGSATVEASASQKTNGSGPGGSDPNGPRPKLYVGSAQAGGQITTVLFISSEELTNNANTGRADQGNDLYAYNLGTGVLSDLSADGNAEDPNGADVGSFLGSSTDGSLVYFTASGVLAPGASSGQPNLYVYDATSGQTTFIAPAAGMSLYPPRGMGGGSLEVTPDGEHLVFLDSENLTSYQQEGLNEVYLYDAASDHLGCISCNPAGVPPTGGATLPSVTPEGDFTYPETETLPAPQVLSDDGSRVFFDSPDSLAPGAPQGPTSVYEYEDGHLYLIAPSSEVLTSTPSGDDVFFSTVEKLAPQDRDGLPDVYDARVDGGFPTIAPPACSGTSCQGVPASAPIFATPASVTFNGVGNFPPPASTPAATTKPKPKPTKCKRGFVKRRNKCIRKPRAKKSAKGRK
jgi:hypothetical protein